MKTQINPLDALVEFNDGNISKTAKLLGLERPQVQQWRRQGFIPWRKDLLIEEKTGGAIKAFDVREYAAWARRNAIT